MMIPRKALRLLSLLCALLLALTLPAPADAAKIVRIGYTDMNGFYYTGSTPSGYVYDLLMETAQLTNREYRFERIRPEDCCTLLQNGQIDLCFGVSEAVPDRHLLSFSAQPVITVPLSMVVLPQSDIAFEDHRSLMGKRIGAYGLGGGQPQLEAFLAEHQIQAELTTDYPSRQAMLDELEAGLIDAAVLPTDLGLSGLRPIAVFGERPLYLAALADGDQAMLQETSDALRTLLLSQPDLLTRLHTRYRLLDDDIYPSLTADEMKYLAKDQTITVALPRINMLDSNTPIENVTSLLSEITKKVGLHFTYDVYDNQGKALAALRGGKADIMLAFDNDYSWAHEQNVWVSNVYLDSTYRVVKHPDTQLIRTLAVVENSYVAYRLERDGGYQPLRCLNEAACMQAVLDGEADAAICWTPNAEHALYELGNHGLVYSDVGDFGGSVSIAVSKMTTTRLMPLINKAISSIRPERFQDIAVPAVGETFLAKQETQTRRLTLALALTLLGGLLLLTVVGLCVAHFLRASSLRAKARIDYLRSTIRQIRQPSQTIQGVAVGGARLSHVDSATAIQHAGLQLSELASEMEAISQLDDHTFAIAPAPVRPEAVFQRLADYVRQQAEARGIHLDIRIPVKDYPVVMLDEEAYRRICLTIFDNVISRSKSGDHIELSFMLEQVHEQRDHWMVTTSIDDTGSMLSRQFVRRIADRTRWDSEQVLGLRLMMAKRIVHAMNGEMGVRQRPNAGMRMFVSVPVVQAEPLQIMSLNHGVYSDKGLLAGDNYLLAEENPITAQLLYSLLVNEGAHVDLVQNGQELLDQFLASSPAFYQAILTDIDLPVLSGAAVAANIRNLPRRDSNTVFIIGMKSGTCEMDPDEAKAMSVILPKPVNTSTLCKKLLGWLHQS